MTIQELEKQVQAKETLLKELEDQHKENYKKLESANPNDYNSNFYYYYNKDKMLLSAIHKLEEEIEFAKSLVKDKDVRTY